MTDSNRGQLLIVDDEVEILKSLRRLFRRSYDVHLAQSAAEGQAIMENHPIEVIISDQRMPQETGTEFLDRVRREYPDSIRLILTGFADIDAIIDSINKGQIFRYVTKPWNPDELESTIDQAFTRYRLSAENKRLVSQLKEANEFLEERVRMRTTELAEANEKLVALNNTKNRFLGIAAHDLRTPLAVIQGMSRLLSAGIIGEVNEKQMTLLGRISRSSEFMLGLVGNLLDVSQIEAGQLNLDTVPRDIAGLVTDNVALNRLLAEQKGINLTLDVVGEVGSVEVDGPKLEQVLNNLISNAIKFCSEGATVAVRFTREGGFVAIYVRDNGPGIPAEDLDRLFLPFERASVRSTAGEKGTGLGLAIVQKIVRSHGGEVTVESKVGVGTTFCVKLPA